MTAITLTRISAVTLALTIGLHAAEKTAAVDDALAVIGSARRVMTELPVLSGTEGFSTETFRTAIMEARGATPYEAFVTANAVVEIANASGTIASNLATFNVGWAALEVNWAFAALLGDSAAAARLLQESNTLIDYQAAFMANVEQAGNAGFASFYPKSEANSHAMILRRIASEMNLIALIPNALDPEGFIRQRMEVARNRLANTAEYIHYAGEAFTLIYY